VHFSSLNIVYTKCNAPNIIVHNLINTCSSSVPLTGIGCKANRSFWEIVRGLLDDEVAGNQPEYSSQELKQSV
jgi:hypothetical protein